MNKIYKNSTEVAQIGGVPIYMDDVVDACLLGRLNLFLQGDTGSGKTQLAADAMSYFPDKSMFILGRNDMDIRELFQRINLDKLRTAGSSQELRELTDKIINIEQTNKDLQDKFNLLESEDIPQIREQIDYLINSMSSLRILVKDRLNIYP